MKFKWFLLFCIIFMSLSCSIDSGISHNHPDYTYKAYSDGNNIFVEDFIGNEITGDIYKYILQINMIDPDLFSKSEYVLFYDDFDFSSPTERGSCPGSPDGRHFMVADSSGTELKDCTYSEYRQFLGVMYEVYCKIKIYEYKCDLPGCSYSRKIESHSLSH